MTSVSSVVQRLFAVLATGAAALGWGCHGSSNPTSAATGVRVKVDTTYYDVDGTEPRAWRLFMASAAAAAGLAPPAVGATRATTSWSYASTRSTAAGCELRQPSVALEIHYVVPRLRSDSGVAPAALAEWRRYMVSLWRHEEGHALRNARGAAELREELRRLHPVSCDMIDAVLRAQSTAVLAKFDALNKAYDVRTAHGARQGVILIANQSIRLPIDTTFRDTMP